MNEKSRKIYQQEFDKNVKRLKDNKFNVRLLRYVKVFGRKLKIDIDEISLYQNGHIDEDILCVCIAEQNITRYKNNDWDEYLNNITKFIREEFDISLDDFLLKNFSLLITVINEKEDDKKTEKEFSGFASNLQWASRNICSFFEKAHGMEKFIKRFSNFNNFSFLKTINKMTMAPNLNLGQDLWNDRSLDDILMEYIYNKHMETPHFMFLTKECELNYLPNIPAPFLDRQTLDKLITHNENKPQILISSTTDDLSNLGGETITFPQVNIRQRQCVIFGGRSTPNLIHICFYNISYENFYESLKLCNFNNLKWNKFIHLNDSVLHINEDEVITSYPKFYQLLIGNSLKFKKLITNILHLESGIDHYAITSGDEHKEWLNNFPFDNENLRFKFNQENLDITFNDFFRGFVEIDEHPNLEQNNGLVNDLFFYKIKQNSGTH